MLQFFKSLDSFLVRIYFEESLSVCNLVTCLPATITENYCSNSTRWKWTQTNLSTGLARIDAQSSVHLNKHQKFILGALLFRTLNIATADRIFQLNFFSDNSNSFW